MNRSRTNAPEVAPVACTLRSQDLARQAGRWNDLNARAGLARLVTEDGLRLSFARAPGIENELRELASVEQECCAWADWTVEVEDDRVVLCVRSTGEGVAVLHRMFTS